MGGQWIMTMGFDSSFLPRITLFKRGTAMSSLKAMSSVLSHDNENLAPLQKIWLRWHIKLGHLAFAHVQRLGLGGFLDKGAMGLLRSKMSEHPKCASCQCGKQTRMADGSTTTVKNKDCLLYTSPSPRDQRGYRMPSSA